MPDRLSTSRRPVAVLLGALLLSGPPVLEAAAQSRANPEPGVATRGTRSAVRAARFMAVAANPLAVKAATEILREGGSAVDAAIAAQLVLNLVEPQSSGIGGGAFLLHWDKAAKKLTTYDGRETAPKAIDPEVFSHLAGSREGFFAAIGSGASVGVPGTLRMLELAHKRHGRLPWPRLFGPAIRLAEGGFAMSPRLNALLQRYRVLANDDEARAVYFTPAGLPKPVGATVTNKRFAETLRAIVLGGADAFYKGPIADEIVKAVRRAPGPSGAMTTTDLAGYRPRLRAPVCGRYRAYRVCGMGPPSSGGTTVIQMLGILQHFDLAKLGPASPTTWHLFAEAGALAFADRNRFLADPDFVRVPVAGLLDRTYMGQRAATIRPKRVLGRAIPGVPAGQRGRLWGDGVSPEFPSTSHLSIVDAAGNAVSLTTTIEHAFGSRRMVRGFLLNNELTDFSFRTKSRRGRPVANRVEPGKRPRSSMAPTMVFDAKRRLVLVIGSPGGSRIIGYVAQRLVAVLDWKMDVQRAIDMGHVQSRNSGIELEAGTPAAAHAEALRKIGHRVRVGGMNSGLHGIQILPDGTLLGGADPRREGIAAGE